MKRYWPTAVLALVFTALGLYLYLVEFPAKESEERAETEKKKVLTFEEQTISSLIFKTDRDELVFERSPEKGWMLVKPIRTEVDTRELNNLIRTIVLASVHRVVETNPTAQKAQSCAGLNSMLQTLHDARLHTSCVLSSANGDSIE